MSDVPYDMPDDDGDDLGTTIRRWVRKALSGLGLQR